MKKLVLLLILLGTSFLAFAQNQVATLQHEGNISVFFGVSALASAHEAAVVGDTITLSSGSFDGCEISKAIVVHGAGCVEDTMTGFGPTFITNELVVFNNIDTMLCFEGVQINTITAKPYSYWDLHHVLLKKCTINTFRMGKMCHAIGSLQIENCIVKDFSYSGCSAVFTNSVLKVSGYANTYPSSINSIYNSLLVCQNGVHMDHSSIYSSIIATSENNSVSNTTFYNCLGIQQSDSTLFVGQMNSTNMTLGNYEDVFETFTGDVTFDNVYQLKHNVATSFLGHDGTEVGIYGGMMPYRTRSNYMIIKNCNVAGRTTEDNKLSVEIELFNAGE